MKVVIQRVSSAAVTVDNQIVGSIGAGLLLFVGFGTADTDEQIPAVVDKISTLRIFSDDQGKFAKSVLDIEGSVLIVSQFTLYADIRKGRRPELSAALAPKAAEELYNEFVAQFRKIPGVPIATGQFGADMKVSIENDGPVTIVFER